MRKMLLCTTIAQSNTLIGNGLSPDSADMYWTYEESPDGNVLWGSPVLHHRTTTLPNKSVPAWSLTALLCLLAGSVTLQYSPTKCRIEVPFASDYIEGADLVEAAYKAVGLALFKNYPLADKYED